MTAIAERSGWRTDRPFFLTIFCVMAATIFAGFANSGRSFGFNYDGLPLLLRVHATVFSAWVIFLIVQNALVVSGSFATHRRLGWLGAGWAVLMVGLGIATTLYVEATNHVPAFFPKSIFLVMNVLGILIFGVLVGVAIRLRSRPDWHKRLMLVATVVIMTAALGRLLPMDAFGAAAPAVLFATALLYIGAGMIYDLVARRRVHPAYYWGGGTLVAFMVAIPVIAFSPLGQGATAALIGHAR